MNNEQSSTSVLYKDYEINNNSSECLETFRIFFNKFIKQKISDLEKEDDIVIIERVNFPNNISDVNTYFEYFSLLFDKKVEFNNCSFSCDIWRLAWAGVENWHVAFNHCRFKNELSLIDANPLKDGFVFNNCSFELNVKFNTNVNKVNNLILKDCAFAAEFIVDNILVNTELLIYTRKVNISSLNLMNCELAEKFKLNGIVIDTLSMCRCVFNKKFEMKNAEVGVLCIDDCNFIEIVDFYESKFRAEFKIKKSIFKGFAAFEKTEFAKESKNAPEFTYATFESFVNFRYARFDNGLNFELVNLKDYPNFLGVFIEKGNTTKETFRIVKHSLDKIGNKVEADHFFRLEMSKHKDSLNVFSEEWIVFWFNAVFSNFGRTFVRPLLIFIGLLIIEYGIIELTKSMCVNYYVEILNTLAKLSPFSKLL